MRQSWETMTSVSAGQITDTDPTIGGGRPQRESNPGLYRVSYRAPQSSEYKAKENIDQPLKPSTIHLLRIMQTQDSMIRVQRVRVRLRCLFPNLGIRRTNHTPHIAQGVSDITHVHTFYAFAAQNKSDLNVVHVFYLSLRKMMFSLSDPLIIDPVILHASHQKEKECGVDLYSARRTKNE